jgi:hypothetical protein
MRAFSTFGVELLRVYLKNIVKLNNGANMINRNKFQVIAITPIPEGLESGSGDASMDPNLREPVKCSASAVVSSIVFVIYAVEI